MREIFSEPRLTMTAPVARDKPNSFQDLILRLQNYWAEQGCAIIAERGRVKLRDPTLDIIARLNRRMYSQVVFGIATEAQHALDWIKPSCFPQNRVLPIQISLQPGTAGFCGDGV